MNLDETAKTGPFTGVPLTIVDLCQSLCDFVERTVGIRPDYTPDTLPLVDHYARTVREDLKSRPELLDLTAQGIGAYFGEVVRRDLAGFWVLPTSNYHDWQLCGSAAYVSFNPIGVGYDSATGGQTHEGPSSQLKLASEDRNGVQDRLELLPPVDEDQFYDLTTRMEVLEIVMEGVRSQAISRGYDETTYEADDYTSPVRPFELL